MSQAEAYAVRNNLTSMAGGTGACSNFGRFALFIFCSMVRGTVRGPECGCPFTDLPPITRPAVFSPGAKGLLIWKGERSPLTERTLQITGQQLKGSYINNTYWMLAKPLK